jgi:putative membrane protein
MSRSLQYTVLLISVLIPLLVGVMLFLPGKLSFGGNWNLMLPHINGSINTITTLVLTFGFIMIRNGKINLHKGAMSTAFFLGVIFLISYILYHSTATSTVYGDIDGNGILEGQELVLVGSARMVYLLILLSHIVFAIAVVPIVLLAFYFALTNKIERHKKIVRYTLPIWLYVSLSGVAVYFMIRPYY